MQEPEKVVHPDYLLTEQELADWLRIAPHTLANRRVSGVDSPPFVKLSGGRRGPVRYRRSDVLGWIEKRTRTNTAGGLVTLAEIAQ